MISWHSLIKLMQRFSHEILELPNPITYNDKFFPIKQYTQRIKNKIIRLFH